MWQHWSGCNLGNIGANLRVSCHTQRERERTSLSSRLASSGGGMDNCICDFWGACAQVCVHVRTGGVIYQCPTLSEVLAPSILEGKGGNTVRGYPSILPCLLCLSCSLCFLNTIHAGWVAEKNCALTCTAKNWQKEKSDDTEWNNQKGTTYIADLKQPPNKERSSWLSDEICAIFHLQQEYKKKESRLLSAVEIMSHHGFKEHFSLTLGCQLQQLLHQFKDTKQTWTPSQRHFCQADVE